MHSPSPAPNDLWRVAALSMMKPAELAAALQGGQAAAWVKAAAACGLAEAQVRLGRMLMEEGDQAGALACFGHAAEKGDADGHNMLGRCYENGWGTAKDYVRAAHHCRAAAELGLDWAQYNLGHMLLNGSGVPRDPGAAFAWYAQAAAQGHVRAMNLLGRCHDEGWGTKRDRSSARLWYCRAAQGGYFRGAYNYADLLAAEDCIAGALYWFGRAAAWAQEPTRRLILKSLAARPHPALRALAIQPA
jgi:uncharacterized protein